MQETGQPVIVVVNPMPRRSWVLLLATAASMAKASIEPLAMGFKRCAAIGFHPASRPDVLAMSSGVNGWPKAMAGRRIFIARAPRVKRPAGSACPNLPLAANLV